MRMRSIISDFSANRRGIPAFDPFHTFASFSMQPECCDAIDTGQGRGAPRCSNVAKTAARLGNERVVRSGRYDDDSYDSGD
jgi:hypothetical protein